MSIKKHDGHPNLTGEHRWGDTVQLIFLLVFLVIWISDSFIFHWSTFLKDDVGLYLRLPVSVIILLTGWFLARRGMKQVFGTVREKPELISDGVFAIIRHPIYTGALCFYLGVIVFTMSLISMVFWLVILTGYILIARFEEKILIDAFGKAYRDYMKKTGMIFPKLIS